MVGLLGAGSRQDEADSAAAAARIGSVRCLVERIVTGYKAVEVVQESWHLMATNDFFAVCAVLAPEFVLEWPQSQERIRGAERFALMNQEYPAYGS